MQTNRVQDAAISAAIKTSMQPNRVQDAFISAEILLLMCMPSVVGGWVYDESAIIEHAVQLNLS